MDQDRSALGPRLLCGALALFLWLIEFPLRAEPTRDFWRVILPLGGSDGQGNATRAFDMAAGLAEPFKKFLFVSRYEPDLDRVLDLILLNSTSLDLKGLYEKKGIPWKDGPDGRRYFRFGGRIEPEDYHFWIMDEPPDLTNFGDTHSTFSLQPVEDPRFGEVYVIRYSQSWYTGPFGPDTYRAINQELLRFIDISDAELGEDPAAYDRLLRDRFAASMPAVTREAATFFDVGPLVRPVPLDGGTRAATRMGAVRDTAAGPAAAGHNQARATALDFRFGFKDRLLKESYPHFRKAHRALSASHLRMRIQDPQGRDLIVLRLGGGEFRIRLITRDGMLVPMNAVTGEPAGEPEPMHMLLTRPHMIKTDNSVRVIGMRFGMDDVDFGVVHQDEHRYGLLSTVPEPILPPIIGQLFAPFVRSYYEVLYSGNNGRGMSFEGWFDPAKNPGNHILTHSFELPLQNSSLLSFFLKAGNQFRRSLPYEARLEFLAIVDRFSSAIEEDYRRARSCLARPAVPPCV